MRPVVHEFGQFRFDAGERKLTRNGALVQAMPKVLDLLDALLRGNGRVLTKEQLMREVWPDVYVDEGSLTRTMSRLREILGPDAKIETVAKRGYRFAADVQPASVAPRATAVLPFIWLTKPPDDLRFLDIAFADTLITRLSRLDAIEVRPTSAVAFLKPSDDLHAVARDLRVDLVVEGRIQMSAGRVRATVQLLSPEAPKAIWAETFDGAIDDLFSFQDAIARALMVVLAPQTSTEVRRIPDARAYELYLRGRYLTFAYTFDAWREAIEALTAATVIDPEFADAHAALASAYFIAAGSFLSPAAALVKGRDAAAIALRCDPANVDAQLTTASLRLCLDHDVAGALEAVQRAVMLGPNQSHAHHVLAWQLMAQRRFAEAERAMARAGELDPTSAPIRVDSGRPAYLAHDYGSAIELFRSAAEAHPQFWYAHTFAGLALVAAGRVDDGERATKKGVELAGANVPEAATAHAYALARQRRVAEAIAFLDETRERAAYVSPFEIATVILAVGDEAGALRWLRRAIDAKDKWVMWIATDPRLDELRHRPAFEELVHAAGFTLS